MTGEYEHEIQLVEYLEFYAYRHLPNCAFAPNTYTLEQMLLRLFDIAKLSIAVEYPTFLDKNKIMSFFSFENFTVANAIKNITRSINAIPKMIFNYAYIASTRPLTISSVEPSSPSNSDFWFNVTNTSLYQYASGSWFLIPSTFGTTTPAYGNQTGLYFVNTATSQVFITSSLLPILTFINRNGLDNAIVETLNTQFPIAYEKNMNSSDQFTTRSVSNISNAKASLPIQAPEFGGFFNIVPNNLSYDAGTRDNARVLFPSKIDTIQNINIYPPMVLEYNPGGGGTISNLYIGYYFDKQVLINVINDSSGLFTSDEKATIIGRLPDPYTFSRVGVNDSINANYNPATSDNGRANLFRNKMRVSSKFNFDTQNVPATKERTTYWIPFTNELVMSQSFRDGLTGLTDHNPIYSLFVNGSVTLQLKTKFVSGVVPNNEILIQAYYYPVSDIKLTIDNDNDAQDEKFFNQSGKIIDATSISKLITSHTNDSVEGTKIRNARYTNPYSYFILNEPFSISSGSPPTSPPDGDYWFSLSSVQLFKRISGFWVSVTSTNGTITPTSPQQENLLFVNTATSQLFISQKSILPLGQLVRDNNQLYVITQRSIDGQIKDNNEYYNVIYTLSRNRIARSENIVADSSVISYQTPNENLVHRNQLYKDYIELSLLDEHTETPYLPLLKMFRFNPFVGNIGTTFDFTVLSKNEYGLGSPTTVRYIKTPVVFDLHKSKLIVADWQDNNVLGFDLTQTGTTYTQTPIVYTDSRGFANNFEFVFVDKLQMQNANFWYNLTYATNPSVPFDKPNNVPSLFYKESVIDRNNYSILIKENAEGGNPYKKDQYEIPVITYMLQGNDNYSNQGNVVFGDNFFQVFPFRQLSQFVGGFRLHYVVSNTLRFTNENAIKLFKDTLPSSTTRIAEITRLNAFPRNVFVSLYPTLGASKNTTSFKNIAFIATDVDNIEMNFLFAINDYNAVSPNTFGDIKLFINNWKI